MRVTNSMYYDNLYGTNNSKLSKKLFDVNKQIASGLKIQYASDDVSTFTQTMRLDNEITVLGQVKKSTESAYKISNQTDVVMNEFSNTMNRMRVLFVSASNASNSEASRNAISGELRGLESHLKNLSNTSINGQFLFSGSAVDTKPIADDGTYLGNDQSLKAFLGSNVQQRYNLPGSDLFLGEEIRVNREIVSNVVNSSLTAQYPDFTDPTVLGTENIPITADSVIRDLMGDNDNASSGADNHFYLRGVKSDGTAFSQDIKMKDGDKVSELLKNIGDAYGNTTNLNVVNVSLNSFGQIVIEDKLKGSSKLDFHLTAAVDYAATDTNGDGAIDRDAANISDAIYGVANSGQIDNLKYGETNFNSIVNGTSQAANSNLYVKSFTQSSYEAANAYTPVLKSTTFTASPTVANGDSFVFSTVDAGGITTNYPASISPGDYSALKTAVDNAGDFIVGINGDTLTFDITAQGAAKNLVSSSLTNNLTAVASTSTNSVLADDIYSIAYDRTQFAKTGSSLTSDVSQALKGTNAFATPSTLISEVADLSQGTAGTLDGTSFRLSGKDINGNAYDAQIDFKSATNGGSSFTLNGGATNFSIFDMSSTRAAVDADKMTYRQLMDVVNMVVANQVPSSNTSTAYDKAIDDSLLSGNTFLTYDGKMSFGELNSSDTKASISLHDASSGKIGSDESVMTFNSNNALTIRDPKTDFFKSIDQMIQSVEEYKEYPDASSGDKRGVGMENAIKMMDDLFEHVNRSHSIVGAQSNTLTRALERTQLLEISAMTLRSSTIDTDLAESSLRLTQLSMNYQAMLSTVGKVSQLSLVNYL